MSDDAYLLRIAQDANHVRDLVERLMLRPRLRIRSMELQSVRRPDPGEAIVSWRIALANSEEEWRTFVTVRLGPAWRLSREFRRFAARSDDDRTTALVPAALARRGSVLLIAFPYDRVLRDLRRVIRPSRVCRLATPALLGESTSRERLSRRRSRFEVVRYLPEDRAVLRWELAVCDVNSGAVARVESIHVHLDPAIQGIDLAALGRRIAGNGLRCPRVLARPHRGVTLETTVAGEPWNGDADGAHVAGRALARLHSTAPPAQLSRYGVIDEHDATLAACRELDLADPWIGERAFGIAEELAKCIPANTASRALLHGDLRPGRFLLCDGDAGFVGLSRATSGPPARDLASLKAWCAAARLAPTWIEPFELGYAAERSLPDDRESAWFLASAMVRAAAEAVRRPLRTGAVTTGELVDRSASVLMEHRA